MGFSLRVFGMAVGFYDVPFIAWGFLLTVGLKIIIFEFCSIMLSENVDISSTSCIKVRISSHIISTITERIVLTSC